MPHASTLARFARDADTTVEWLLAGDGETPDMVMSHSVPPSRRHELASLDARESLVVISESWAEFWLGADDDHALLLAHADIDLPPDVAQEEPVIFKGLDWSLPHRVSPGEILLLHMPDGSMRVRRAGPNGDHEGEVSGTALWTGHRLNRFLPRKK